MISLLVYDISMISIHFVHFISRSSIFFSGNPPFFSIFSVKSHRFLMKLSNESVVVELKNSTVVQVRKSWESCAAPFKKALEGWKNGGISRGYQGDISDTWNMDEIHGGIFKIDTFGCQAWLGKPRSSPLRSNASKSMDDAPASHV